MISTYVLTIDIDAALSTDVDIDGILRHGLSFIKIMDTWQGTVFKMYAFLGPMAYFYPAPFGRYGSDSGFSINGKLAWVIQEIVGPASFIYYLWPKIALGDLDLWQRLIALMYTGHYVNRTLIWPMLMMPSMSHSHL